MASSSVNHRAVGNEGAINLEGGTPSSEQPTCEQPNSEEPKAKKPKSLTSNVWDVFTKIGIVDGKEKAKCGACGKEYVHVGSNGTSTLQRHMKKCVAIPRFGDVGAMMLDAHGRLRTNQLDHKRVREVIAMSIVVHDLPFSFVEYKWIRELHRLLNPNVKSYTRNTAMNDVWKLYIDKKEKLKEELARIPSRVCLTCDCWTAYTVEGYICVTAHYVDTNWKLRSKILAFCKMEPPHTGIELAGKVFDCLKEWGIDKKVFSLTLDNASANDSMQNILKQHLSLQNSLLCEGKYFHIRCCAHILNLIVQEGLKAASCSLQKIRESIKYIKGSEARKIIFAKCVEQVGGIDSTMGLRLDVPTRWNSTYVMLESALKYERALGSLTLHDKNFLTCPSSEEWNRGKLIRDFLKPFYIITNLFSGSSYPTSSLYFMQIWTIEQLLIENEHSDDAIIQNMAKGMKEKFDKYWKEYNVILAIASILDPRAKLDMIKHCYKKLGLMLKHFYKDNEFKWEKKIDMIKTNMYELFSSYEASANSVQPSSESRHASSSNVQASSSQIPQFNYFGEYFDVSSENDDILPKSELDLYLEEPKLDLKFYMDLDVLQYWKEKEGRYPCLSKMAYDVLSIPITTVASESSFSIGSRVLTKYRCSLLPENVQALICTRNWLQGFEWEVKDLDDDSDDYYDVDNMASNILDEDQQ